MVDKFFDKKSSVVYTSGGAINSRIMPNQQLADELQKSIIRKFEKHKGYLSFKDNIWEADLADMQLIIKFNKGFSFLMCVIDTYNKHKSVVPVKDKKAITITNALQKVLSLGANQTKYG